MERAEATETLRPIRLRGHVDAARSPTKEEKGDGPAEVAETLRTVQLRGHVDAAENAPERKAGRWNKPRSQGRCGRSNSKVT